MSEGTLDFDPTRNVWEQIENLTDHDLAVLVQSALFVLERAQPDAVGDRVGEMPPGIVKKELEDQLAQRGAEVDLAARLVDEAQFSRPLAMLLLNEIAEHPVLAQSVEDVWRERSNLLVVEGGVILSAALLLLVLKLKKVKVSDTGVEVDFEQVSDGALGKVLKFVGLG